MGKKLPGRQPFYAHLAELRNRVFAVAASLVGGGVVGYIFREEVKDLLIRPLGQTLYYSSPTGGFDFIFRICLFFGLALAVPTLIYQLLRFVEPIIPKRSRFMMFKFMLASVVLCAAGVSFAYFISLPAALDFLNKFSTSEIKALISADQYFSFIMTYLIGFMLLFQLPLLLVLIHKVTPLDPGGLMKHQRVVILFSFIVAAILTPTPDPMNQSLMAAPMIGLYQISVGSVWAARRGERRRLRKWRGQVRVPSTQELKLLRKHLEKMQPLTQAMPVAAPVVMSRVLDFSTYSAAMAKEHKTSKNILDLRSRAHA